MAHEVALLRQKIKELVAEKEALMMELEEAKKKGKVLDELLARGVLSQDQLDQVMGFHGSRGIRWSTDTVAKAVGLRCLSKKAFSFVSTIMNIPLPSESTLSRRTRSFEVDQVQCTKVCFIEKEFPSEFEC